MTILSLLRILLIAALISFASRAEATCLTTGTMPTEQHASDCADMVSGSDHAPQPAPGKHKMPPCAFACIALASASDAPLLSSQPVMIETAAMLLKAMVGDTERPPTPPPR